MSNGNGGQLAKFIDPMGWAGILWLIVPNPDCLWVHRPLPYSLDYLLSTWAGSVHSISFRVNGPSWLSSKWFRGDISVHYSVSDIIWNLLPRHLQVLSYRFLHLLLGQLVLEVFVVGGLNNLFNVSLMFSCQLLVFICPRSLALCFLEKVDLTKTSELLLSKDEWKCSHHHLLAHLQGLQWWALLFQSLNNCFNPYKLFFNRQLIRRVFCWCPEVSCILRARCHLTGLLRRHRQF